MRLATAVLAPITKRSDRENFRLRDQVYLKIFMIALVHGHSRTNMVIVPDLSSSIHHKRLHSKLDAGGVWQKCLTMALIFGSRIVDRKGLGPTIKGTCCYLK